MVDCWLRLVGYFVKLFHFSRLVYRRRAFGAPTIVRWLFRLVALSSLHDSLAQSRGYSPDAFVASDFSKLNRWFFHVDEFGVDLDLKEKLKSKATMTDPTQDHAGLK